MSEESKLKLAVNNGSAIKPPKLAEPASLTEKEVRIVASAFHSAYQHCHARSQIEGALPVLHLPTAVTFAMNAYAVMMLLIKQNLIRDEKVESLFAAVARQFREEEARYAQSQIKEVKQDGDV